MHLKSCPKLLRSELRLDLGQQQGALLRRGQSLRVPLAALSTNTLRCSPVGGAVLAARAKGSENAVFTEEEGGGLDVWSVIKPGHVREKIALFAHDTPNERNVRLIQASDTRGGHLTHRYKGSSPAVPPGSGDSEPAAYDSKLSVVEMVAFLEQRVITRSPHAKLRSSTSIMLSRAQPPSSASLLADPQPVPPSDRPISLQQGEEPDSVSVSDMVAKLESQCLRRRTQTEQNHVIKTVTKNTPTMPERSDAIGRGRTQSPPSCQSKPAQLSSQVKLNTTQKCESKETQKSPASTADILRPPVRSEVALAKMIKMEDVFCVKDVTKPDPKPDDAFKTVGPSCVKLKNTPLSEFKTEKSHESPKLEEPLPGLLFLTPPSKVASLSPNSHSDSLVPAAVLLRSSSDVGSERRRRRKATRTFSVGEGRVSEDFLLMRRRVQSLLEPRSSLSYLSLLPHHLLLQILLHLPTRALAALKCTCHYLRLVIDTYDPRPLDALWVCDPRYRDDPCKQCKRRHQRGDVSLCRWHHKPFCQAMPYGPGYWMCCHGDRRDAPGCNVGLHDNRWVPAFHSINAPIYRQRPREEDET
uniref:F-box domain-containing protein n=1 Tax=Periophthalmus magnuspinnatus TaxID=409849 RepID=A0A3B4AH50_9GOBI